MMTTLNPHLLSIDELLKYGKPQTALEEAIFEKLKDAQQELVVFRDVLDSGDRPDEAEGLDEYISGLEANQCPDDYADYKEFFDRVVSVFEGGSWNTAQPSSDELKDAVCDDLRAYAHYIATKDDHDSQRT